MKFFLALFTIFFYFGCTNNSNDIFQKKYSVESIKSDFENFRYIIKYGHPGKYFHTTQKELDKLFDSVYATLNTPHSEFEFYKKLQIIVNRMACIHTSLRLSKPINDTLEQLNVFFPFPVFCIDDKLYFNSSSGDSVKFGSEIIFINKQPAAQVIKELTYFNTADGFNETYAKNNLSDNFCSSFLIQNGAQKKFELVVKDKPDTSTYNLTIAAQNLIDVLDNYRNSVYKYNASTDYDLEFYDEKSTALLVLRSFEYAEDNKQGPYDNFLENTFKLIRLNGTKNLVIDLRDNPGGNYSNTLKTFAYLTNRASLHKCKTAHMIFKEVPYDGFIEKKNLQSVYAINELRQNYFSNKQGNFYTIDSLENEEYYKETINHFNGKIYVLVNGNTASCAAYFAALLKDENRAIIVGTQTGGGATQHSGFTDVNYTLPETKLRFGFSVVATYHNLLNNNQNIHRGVIPDYIKPIAYKDFIATSDMQFNFVYDSLIQKK